MIDSEKIKTLLEVGDDATADDFRTIAVSVLEEIARNNSAEGEKDATISANAAEIERLKKNNIALYNRITVKEKEDPEEPEEKTEEEKAKELQEKVVNTYIIK